MNQLRKNKVIIIGCGTGGLAVIRAFRSCPEVEIIAVAHTESEIGCVSRYVSEVHYCPHPGREEESFIQFLLNQGEKWKDALLIEAGDYMAVTVSKHKARLQKFYRTSIADWPVMQRFIEKSELYKLAEECGVSCPKTFRPKTMDELRALLPQIPYPLILKPTNSHLFVSHYGFKNFQIANEQELLRDFQRCLSDRMEVVVQEIVPGPDSCLERMQTYVNSVGRMSMSFFTTKVRQHPPRFGVMRVGYSAKRNEEVALLTEKLLTHGHYRGYASIEFKRDPRDGVLKLMEVNVRMPRNGQLAIAAGVNVPWIIYQDIVNNKQVYADHYTEGFYWIEILPDVYNMLVNPHREECTWKEYLQPYFSRSKTFAVFDWKDPRPFLRQVWNGIRRVRES